MKKEKYVYRSAITGKFVSKRFAEENPDTTIKQKVKQILTVIVLLFFTIGFAQPKKDDLAHISGMSAIHSASYLTLNVLNEGKGKNWIPFVVGNGVGFVKEYYDQKKPHNYWSWKDIAYNNLGMALSFFLIKGLTAMGMDENVSAGVVMMGGISGLGIVVNF